MKYSIEQISQQYRASIYKICLGYAKDGQEAEDLLQETLVNIWKGLDSFKSAANIKTWIYRITVNTCLLSLRKKKVRTISLDQVQESKFVIRPFSGELNEDFARLHRFIQQLPEKDRIIILLYLEELSHKEIAKVVGITANNVGVRINRIKKILSNKFSTHG